MKLFPKLSTLFRKDRLDADMADEMRQHVEWQTERNVQAGMSDEDARYAALRQFGNVAVIQEHVREARGWLWLEQLRQDAWLAGRGLLRNPGFAATAVLILALAVGATTAFFSVMNAVVLRPLPYAHPERLVRIWDTNAMRGLTDFPASAANFLSWRDASRQMEGLAAWRYGSATLLTTDVPERIEVVRVTANLLPLLGVTPPAGRGFLPEEEQPGRDRVILISERLWQERFQSSPAAFGQVLPLDGEAHVIVGVAPASLQALAAGDVWKPMVMDPSEARSMHWLRVVGRLRPDSSPEGAQREMNGIAVRLAEQFPESNENWGVRLESFQEWIVPPGVRKSLTVLFGAVACVLLVAAANLANLLLVRATARGREIAVRAALGAGRGRLARQFLTEAAVLVALGSAGGWLLAGWSLEALRIWRPGNLPRLDELRLDASSLAFTLAIAGLTVLMVGILPAWQAARTDLHGAMKDGGAGSLPRRRFVQSGLAVLQLALSFALLTGAVLLGRSFLRLQAVPLGFNPEQALVFRVSLPAGRYPGAREQAAFQQELAARIAALPGVSQAGAANAVPFDAAIHRATTRIRGRASALAAGEMLSAERFNVDAGYFPAVGAALVGGRLFDGRDQLGTPPVAIINEAAARRLWPGEDAVGKTVLWNSPFTVIGVVADLRNIDPAQPARPALYLAFGQQPVPTMAVVVRSGGRVAGLPAALRGQLRSLDPALPLFDLGTLEQLRDRVAARPRFNAGLLGGFAGAAVLLAAVGLYGVTAYTVARRTREFGVRMALGARPGELFRLVLAHGTGHALAGIICGLGLAALMIRAIRSLLYEVSASEPWVYAGTAAGLLGITLLACWLPARRAAKVDPVVALRAE